MTKAETPSWAGFLLLDVFPMVAVGALVFSVLCIHVGDVYHVK